MSDVLPPFSVHSVCYRNWQTVSFINMQWVCMLALLYCRYESDRHVRDCVRCYTKDYHTVARRCVFVFHVQQIEQSFMCWEKLSFNNVQAVVSK